MDDRAKAVLLREIDRYLLQGHDLIPLKPHSKIPVEKNWNKINYSKQVLEAHVYRNGCNIGWRLGPLDVVIDVDPRHDNALGSEKQMTEKWGVDNLKEVCPTVHTGGADRGRHYYTTAPEAVKLKTRLDEFDDIDFRRRGHYVLIPGCIHPDTGRSYLWDESFLGEPPDLPDWLMDLLRVDRPVKLAPEASPESMSLLEIAEHLKKIPPEKYQDYNSWLKMGMAIHAACDGDYGGCELFVRWSTSDPLYFDAEASARAKWDSFSTKIKDDRVTAATLVAAAKAEGGSPNAIPAAVVFDEPVQAAPSLMDMKTFQRLLLKSEKPGLPEAVALASKFGQENWDQLRSDLKYSYKVRLSLIDRVKKDFDRAARRKERKQLEDYQARKKRKQMADPAIDIVNYLLAEKFEGGEHLIHARNQQFYEFIGTHWEPLQPNEIDQMIFDAAEAIQLNPENELKFKSSLMFASAQKVLIAKTARRDDVFRFQGPPPPVVNAENCEVWVNPDGTCEQRPHRAESYLLSCLNTDYDPKADCPVFDQTLAEIFEENDDPQGMTRHLFEFFGYVMQPYKNIPTWWMFQGDGSNGKTFCFNVFQRLLGTAVLPRAVEDFADNGRNNHALASLVGKLLIMDDDARVDFFLPESALKKLSEMKLFEANPKRQHAFTFMSCATPVMLINNWPQIRDLSWGLLRKAYILPFKRVFAPEEYDLNREPYVVGNELAGVLNHALKGYSRLRSRGGFAEPKECSEAKKAWLQAANPLVEFFTTQLKKTGNGVSVPLIDVYQAYLIWCRNYGGVKRPPAKNRFEISLKQVGFKLGPKEGIPAVLGCTLAGGPEDVFT